MRLYLLTQVFAFLVLASSAQADTTLMSDEVFEALQAEVGEEPALAVVFSGPENEPRFLMRVEPEMPEVMPQGPEDRYTWSAGGTTCTYVEGEIDCFDMSDQPPYQVMGDATRKALELEEVENALVAVFVAKEYPRHLVIADAVGNGGPPDIIFSWSDEYPPDSGMVRRCYYRSGRIVCY